MGERQLFLISANKSRGDRMQWSDDDYDVGEGSPDGPVIDEFTNYLLRRLGTGGSGRSRPWALKAERLKPAKLRWRNLRRSGRGCAGECIRRSGGPSTKDEKEAAPCPSDFHIVASVENLAAACEKSKQPPKATMHIVNGEPLHDISSSRRSSSLSFTGVRKFCIPYVTLDTGRRCCR